jgi:hypothetical protein
MHVGSPWKRRHHDGRDLKPFTVVIHEHWLGSCHSCERHGPQIFELGTRLVGRVDVDLHYEAIASEAECECFPFESASESDDVRWSFARAHCESHPFKSLIPSLREIIRHLMENTADQGVIA